MGASSLLVWLCVVAELVRDHWGGQWHVLMLPLHSSNHLIPPLSKKKKKNPVSPSGPRLQEPVIYRVGSLLAQLHPEWGCKSVNAQTMQIEGSCGSLYLLGVHWGGLF